MGVRKTSVYLPGPVKDRLAEVARRTGRSEAHLIRLAIERLVDDEAATLGRAGYTRPDDPTAGTTNGARRAVLVGVGIGPGDPELLTVRALRALRRADRVFAPVTSEQAVGRAETILREGAPDVVVERLVFVMQPDPAARADAIDAAGARIAACLDAGEEVAFITLGDPNVYSTFSSVAAAVRRRRPGTMVETIPGIMAFQDLAARTGTVLVDERQTLTLLTGLDGLGPIDAALGDPDRAVVIYKGGRRLTEIAERAAQHGRSGGAVRGELLGLTGERTGALHDASGPATYLATVIIPPRQPASGPPGTAPADLATATATATAPAAP
jgi:precorrin-2/cobalt-factor-2 C20-methyltransferase